MYVGVQVRGFPYALRHTRHLSLRVGCEGTRRLTLFTTPDARQRTTTRSSFISGSHFEEAGHAAIEDKPHTLLRGAMNEVTSRFERWGIVPLRVVVGLVFLMHGGQKLFVFGIAGTADIMGKLEIPAPMLAAAIVIAVELLGGLAILLGAYTKVAGALLAFEMVIAILVARMHGGFFAPYGYEFEMTLLGACLTFALYGPGRMSLEEIWRRSSVE